MQGQFRTHISYDAREVSLQQLAGLWSTAMACLPEVGRCTATFKRRGPSTEHEYIYDDADELAHAGIEAKPGELRLRSIHIYSPDATVDIEERCTTGFFRTLLTLPNTLGVTISGSNERAVLTLRTAIERWGERNLEPRGWGRWPRLGVFVAGFGAAWGIAAVMELHAALQILAMAWWFAVFVFAGWCLEVIPALRRRMVVLRIVNGSPPGGRGTRRERSSRAGP